MVNVDLSGQLAIDANQLSALKSAARQQSPDAVKKVAAQFEAMFVNMMLKSMRDATMQSGLMDNEQTKTFTGMFDQQLSQHIAARGVGLAEVLTRQLSQQGRSVDGLPLEGSPSDLPSAAVPEQTFVPAPISALESRAMAGIGSANTSIKEQPAHVRQFKAMLSKHAEQVSTKSGIPAQFLMGQAALETGWGQRALKGTDGTPSFNLFGIKATGNWQGKVVEAYTTEYINGVKQQRIEKFRAYDSYAQSFEDFAQLMQSTPRYRGVISQTGSIENYALAMQRAGYATDPNYATKLVSVVNRLST